MFLGGSRPGAPFGLRSSGRISFCSSQCLSHFALRNAYHTSLRPSSLFESRPPSLRVVFSLSQCLSHFTALFIVVRCALHRYYRVQLLFTWCPSMLRPSKCSLQRLQLSVSNCCSYGTLLHFGRTSLRSSSSIDIDLLPAVWKFVLQSIQDAPFSEPCLHIGTLLQTLDPLMNLVPWIQTRL